MNNATGMTDLSAPRLWDANDVARYLRVSRSWVYHRVDAGQLPSLRVGGLVRFDPDVVQAFARGEVGSQTAAAIRRQSQRKSRQSEAG